ncbi:MAG: peptidoglycan DD-metalloendopeptidase family protein [Armatimonadota bacterium]|jgi:murein DD-endopeptidase MepM/ murein hydrolase activator NlpD
MAPRIRLTILSFLIFAVAITGASLAARKRAATASPSALRKKYERIEANRERTARNLRVVKRRLRENQRQIHEIRQNLDSTAAQYTVVTRNVRSARSDLAEAVSQYRAAETRLEGHKEDVSDRLVAMYELGEARPVEVLLQATSFTDFANRLYLLNQVVERDAELIDDYEDAQTSADQHRANVAAEERRLSQLQSQVRDQKDRLTDWRDAATEKQSRLMTDKASYERDLAELEQNSHEVAAMLERLEHTRGGQARLAKPWKGSLIFPVQGHITSGFGYRTHPIYHVRKLHTGIDIGASYGAPIHAAAGGVVVFAGRWGGYGNCVIIDHGGGLSTLYGHCSSLSVSEGQEVKQGQKIAAVGATGLATGPHLHFETRRNGRPVNPSGF